MSLFPAARSQAGHGSSSAMSSGEHELQETMPLRRSGGVGLQEA